MNKLLIIGVAIIGGLFFLGKKSKAAPSINEVVASATGTEIITENANNAQDIQ